MPIDLDSCIAGIFTPGNIGASSGQPPVQPTVPSLFNNYGVGLAVGVGSAAGEAATGSIGSAAGIGAATGVAPAAAWTPLDLGAALKVWYEMDVLTGSNGDPQGTITDSSGNGVTLTAAGSARATLAAADLNSLNTLRFTAANSQRYAISPSFVSGASAGSVYLVYKVVSEAANNGLMNFGASGNQNHWPFSDGVQYNDFMSTARKTVGNPTVSLTTTYRIISIYSAANDWAFFIDGGAGGSSGGTTAFFSTGTNTVGAPGSTLGIGGEAGQAFLNGWIAELYITNANQSTGDRQKSEGYLAHKWGLTGNLDSAHPYKSTPP